jgi:tRNA (guanine-N7-)-methyltransferase
VLGERKIRTIRSFIRRERKLSSEREEEFVKLWAEYGLEIETGILDSKLVFGRKAPLFLEIGFGDGTALLKAAIDFPQNDYIGIEVYRPGVVGLLSEAKAYGVKNLRVYQNDAVEVLTQNIPDASLSAVRIFFPDPWPKRRHHKRRLIQSSFLRLLHAKLKPGGYLHFASDWQDYAESVFQLVNLDKGFVRSESPKFFIPRAMSKFAQIGLDAGRKIHESVWIKT